VIDRRVTVRSTTNPCRTAQQPDEPGNHRECNIACAGRAIVIERYYNGERPDGLHDVRSAGKSITSLLAGIAIDRGAIASPEVRVQTVLPAARTSAVADATLADLLTMRSGLDADDVEDSSPGNEDKLDTAPDPVAFAMAAPARSRPGERYVYNSLTAYLVGLTVEQATGQHRDSLAPRVAIGDVDRYADHYGYFWYAKRYRIGGRDVAVSFASGNGGNKIYVVPAYDLVVAITSSAYNQGWGQRRSQDILQAVLAALPPP
jgi:CubicO group peptidase (beta-lactamase class C family)